MLRIRAHLHLSLLGFCLPRDIIGLVYAVTQSLYGHMQMACCVWKLLFPWCYQLRWLLQSFCPLLQRSLSLVVGSDRNFPFRTEQSVLFLIFEGQTVSGTCVNYHLLQKEASLKRVERCSDIWVDQQGVRSSLILYSFIWKIVLGIFLTPRAYDLYRQEFFTSLAVPDIFISWIGS